MAEQIVGLDNSIFAGRLRNFQTREPAYKKRPVMVAPRQITDITDGLRPKGFVLANDPNHQDLKALVVKSTQYNTQDNIAKEPKQRDKAHVQYRPRTFEPPVTAKRSRSKVLKRSLVAKKFSKQKKGFNLKLQLLPAMAGVLFVIGLGVSIWTLKTNRQTTAQVQAISQGVNNAQQGPDESQDNTPLSAYQVAPDMPRFIRISKIGVEARVKPVGVKKNNQLDSPANIHDTGWYNGSSKPGEAGAALIDAHVSGPTKPGVFKNLKQLQFGDVIEIEKGNGQKVRFAVASTKLFDTKTADMASMMLSADPNKPGLNLMTCAGQFDAKTNSYPQRLAVYATKL